MEDEVEYAKRRSKRNRKRCIIGLSILLLLLLLIAIIVVIVLVVVPLFHSETESVGFRLPVSVTPDHYFLELQPYLSAGNFTFDGSVNITVTCHDSTKNITLHSSGLTIHEATVREATSVSDSGIKKIELVPKYELLILHLKDELKSGKIYQLRFVFSGKLETSVGFYWRSYLDANGVKKYIAATKFKPTFARRAFPCFDEPSFKATFTITIVRANGLSSLSTGGNKTTKERGAGWTADIYLPTIKISTYLLGFFVGEYAAVTKVTKDEVSVVASFQSIKYAEDAMAAAKNASEFYSSKLRLPRPMPNLALVAIPDEEGEEEEEISSDSSLLGEESTSWGLIMMDESSMLIKPQDGEWRKQNVAMRVAHQVAHQVFEILVTPKWWNELWLTESIAMYLGMEAADNKINQKWKMLDALKRSSDYVEFDCSESSQPLSMAVDNPSDLPKSFSRALHKKGARLIDMARFLLEDKLFRQGLSKYLQETTFSVSDADGFWRNLSQAQKNGKGKIDFQEVMKSWIQNRGHPIVTLERDYSKGKGLLYQQSCLNESAIWRIPITYTFSQSVQPELIWLNSAKANMSTMPNENSWVLLNGNLSGFFHVNYDAENWKMLALQLRDDYSKFPPLTRYQLLYDALFLSRRNITTYNVLFDLLLYMRQENDIDVKEFLAEAKLSEIWKMLRMSKVDSKWKDFVLRVTGDTYSELFENEAQPPELELLPKLYLKQEIATSACYYDREKCTNDALNKAKTWLNENEPFKEVSMKDSFVIRPYLCTAVRKNPSNDDKIHDCLKENRCDYLQNKTVAKDLLYALGCSNEEFKMSIYIERYIIGNGDPGPIIESMLNSHTGSKKLFHTLMTILNRLTKNYNRLELVVKKLSEAIANPEELKKMKKVFNTFIDKMNKEEENKKEATRITTMLDSYTDIASKRLEFAKYQLLFMTKWLNQYPNA